MSEENPTSPTRNARPGALNALLLAVSVAVILGIYGYSIFLAKSRDHNVVLAPVERTEPTPPPRQIIDEPAEEAIDATDPDASEPAEPEARPPVVVAIVEEVPPIDESEAPPNAENEVAANDPEVDDGEQDDGEQEQVAVIDEQPPVIDEEEYLKSGWKTEAGEVLARFMAATNLEDRLALVINPERVASQLRALQRQEATPWQNLSPDDFKHVDLSDADRRKGIFLMLREAPGDDPSTTADRSYAFFKRTDDGLKLDFEVFSQTTGQAFPQFIERPQPGVSRIFRVFITEDPTPRDATNANSSSYFVAGLANMSTATRIRITTGSPVGRILAAADFNSEDGTRRVMRNATVELRWTDQPNHSAVELSRFICWEFLGLGGEPLED